MKSVPVGAGFELKKVWNCLLAFDDSCNEIHQEEEFVKVEVSNRLKDFTARWPYIICTPKQLADKH